MSAKITIIGAGSVGSTIAYTLAMENSGASEIVLIDINKEKVLGEVMDIAQGTFFRDPVSIVAGDYEDAKDSDIVIITSGIARRPVPFWIPQDCVMDCPSIIKLHRKIFMLMYLVSMETAHLSRGL